MTSNSEPRGNGAWTNTSGRRRTRRADAGAAVGCLVSGGVGVVVLLVMVVIAAQSLQGCDFNLGSIGPGDGKASKRLDVAVSPTIDLVDGQSVLVTTTALRRSQVVGLTQCLREADTKRAGLDACDQNQLVRYAKRGPKFQREFVVRQVLTIRGRAYDCALAPGRCLVVASSANDYDRSGGRPLTFRPNPVTLKPAFDRPASAHLPITGSPTGPVRNGTRIRLTASGFQPGEPLLYARCTDDLDRRGVTEACDPLDSRAAFSAIAISSLPNAPRAGPEGSIQVSLRAAARITPYSGFARGGTVDCTVRPGRCSLVIAAAADPHRSAVLPYEIAAG